MKLMCLDDDPRMESTLRRFAGRLGHQVSFHTASSTFKAQVKDQAPDLLVLDLSLGRESGIDVIAWLAQAQVQAPVVLLSGHGDDLLDTARRIARASGIEVLGAVNKGLIVRDLPPLLALGLRAAEPPEAPPLAAPTQLTAEALAGHIRERRIEPWFQPIVSPADGRVRGAEVLVRLRLPSGEVLGADAIVPPADSVGLILPLTEALFIRLIEYKGQLKPLNLEFLSVNLSATALDHEPAVALVRTLVERLEFANLRLAKA